MVQISIDPRGIKTCRKQCGGQAKKGQEKILETPHEVCYSKHFVHEPQRLYLHVLCLSKLWCRCYIFFLYSRFLTLGKTLIRIMPEFGILLQIYIDSEAHFLSTFLCTKASRQFSPPSPRTFRCCKVSPTLPSGKIQNSPRIQGKRRMYIWVFPKIGGFPPNHPF